MRMRLNPGCPVGAYRAPGNLTSRAARSRAARLSTAAACRIIDAAVRAACDRSHEVDGGTPLHRC